LMACMPKSVSDFKKYYASHLSKTLEPLEAQRKATLFALIQFGAIGLAVWILMETFLYHAYHEGKFGDVGFWLLSLFNFIGCVAGVGIPFSKKSRNYHATFKSAVIGGIIRWLAEGLEYFPYERIPDDNFNASGIYNHKPDRSSGTDLVRGTIDKTWIRFSLLHTEYKTTETDKDGHTETTWHTIFNGIFFVGDFNKHFNGHTLVVPASANKLMRMLTTPIFGGDKIIALENPEFGKRFQVFSSDQVEARYILSTSLMERLLTFVTKANNEVKISFVHSCVFIGISTGSRLFEPKYFRSIVSYSACERYFLFLNLAVGVVEDLNLNLRIWTKQ